MISSRCIESLQQRCHRAVDKHLSENINIDMGSWYFCSFKSVSNLYCNKTFDGVLLCN